MKFRGTHDVYRRLNIVSPSQSYQGLTVFCEVSLTPLEAVLTWAREARRGCTGAGAAAGCET